MQLISKRIKVAPFDNSDRDLFIEMSMCAQMMEHVYEPCTFEEAKEAFEVKSKAWTAKSDGWLSLGITELSTGEKLGNIGLKIISHEVKIAEVGFMIKEDAQGKGFAGEALSLINEYAFTQLNLNKLVATCSVNNTGSYKLLEKIGFVREGCLKQNALVKNKRVDDYIYGLCKSDLKLA